MFFLQVVLQLSNVIAVLFYIFPGICETIAYSLWISRWNSVLHDVEHTFGVGTWLALAASVCSFLAAVLCCFFKVAIDEGISLSHDLQMKNYYDKRDGQR